MPLCWLFAEAAVNPKYMTGYVFPGTITSYSPLDIGSCCLNYVFCMTCIPHIVIRVCVAMFVKAYHLVTLTFIGDYLGHLWP